MRESRVRGIARKMERREEQGKKSEERKEE